MLEEQLRAGLRNNYVTTVKDVMTPEFLSQLAKETMHAIIGPMSSYIAGEENQFASPSVLEYESEKVKKELEVDFDDAFTGFVEGGDFLEDMLTSQLVEQAKSKYMSTAEREVFLENTLSQDHTYLTSDGLARIKDKLSSAFNKEDKVFASYLDVAHDKGLDYALSPEGEKDAIKSLYNTRDAYLEAFLKGIDQASETFDLIIDCLDTEKPEVEVVKSALDFSKNTIAGTSNIAKQIHERAYNSTADRIYGPLN